MPCLAQTTTAEGRVVGSKVNDKAALKHVKAGDQVVAVLYEALAVGVRPAHCAARSRAPS